MSNVGERVGNWVASTKIEGVAAPDSVGGEYAALENAVLPKGFKTVL